MAAAWIRLLLYWTAEERKEDALMVLPYRPEIHSGDEDFGIDSFAWPSAQPAIARDREDQTIFIMPLRNPEANGDEVADGLRIINLDTLLVLREIDSIEWSLPSGESGTCVRQFTSMDNHVRQVTLTGEVTGHDDIDQDWLVFSKPIHGDGEELAGGRRKAFWRASSTN